LQTYEAEIHKKLRTETSTKNLLVLAKKCIGSYTKEIQFIDFKIQMEAKLYIKASNHIS